MIKRICLFFSFWLILSILIFSSRVYSADINISEKNWNAISEILHSKEPYHAHDRQNLYEALQWPKDCEENFRSTNSLEEKNIGIAKYSLGPGQFLLQISCGSHAYQGSFIYYFIDLTQKKSHLVHFKTIDVDNHNRLIMDKTAEIAGEPRFNNGKLTIFSLARGAGGCGALITYAFNKGEAYILEAKARSCNAPMDKANKLANPENWPMVYRDTAITTN